MSAVVIAGNTSGTITLQAPAVAGSTVLNLPTLSGGTLVTSDSSGNVLIGSNTAVNTDLLQVMGTSGTITQAKYSANTTPAYFKQYKSRGTTVGSNVAVQNLDGLGANIVYGYDGTSYVASGQTVYTVSGAVSTNIVPTNYNVYTMNTSGTLGLQFAVDYAGNTFINSGYGSVAIAYGCRAWVNFNGTGTVAIRGSGNVSSITDNAAGDFTVNLTTAMPDTNYSAVFSAGQASNINLYAPVVYPLSTSTIRIWTAGGSNFDSLYSNFALFR